MLLFVVFLDLILLLILCHVLDALLEFEFLLHLILLELFPLGFVDFLEIAGGLECEVKVSA